MRSAGSYRWVGVYAVSASEISVANSAAGTTFTRTAADRMLVVRQGTPPSTTTYAFVATTDTLGRVGSVFRKLGSNEIERRTVWDTSFPTEPASVTDNYGALLSTPARTVSYTYVAGSPGLVARMTEPLTATRVGGSRSVSARGARLSLGERWQ